MALNLEDIQTGVAAEPPRIIIYGPAGVGKSRFAANAPVPIFIQTEDGTGKIDAPRFPLAKEYRDVLEALTALASEKHQYKTVVTDSIDWLEPLIWAKVAKDNGVKSIEDIGYGKGYVQALNMWREYLEALNYLRRERGMIVIQTAHADIKRFNSPETDPYDRFVIKLHDKASALLQENSDILLFANYNVSTKKDDIGFGNKRTRAIGNGERVVYTQERPAFAAKNRYDLPEVLPLDLDGGSVWSAIAEHVPFFAPINNAPKKGNN